MIDSLNTGGAEMLAVNSVNLLNNAGIDAYLCATREEGLLKERVEDLNSYLFLNKKRTIDVQAIRKLHSFIQINSIGIIHAHSTSYFLATIAKVLNPKLKIVWHDHYGNSENLHNRKSLVLRISSFFFSTIICVNQNLYNWSKKFLSSKNVFYLKNFSIASSPKNSSIALKSPDTLKVVLLAGGRPQKNHELMIDVMNILIKKSYSLSLHLFGDFSDYEVINRVRKLINLYSLNEVVHFYGAVLDVQGILNQSDIGVLCSDSEGLPIALLDYGEASLPVVVTDVGQCKEVLQNGKNGVLVPKRDSKKFASGLEKLILNKDLRKQYGFLLNEHVKAQYSSENYIQTLKDIYYNA